MVERKVFAVIGIAAMVALGMPLHARAETATTATTTANVHDAAEVEKKVREKFADAPVMAEIARCESKFRQYTDSGNPLRGGYGGGMVGVFQFHASVHTTAAKALGFDIETLDGNLGYARHVYDKSGTGPWNSSFSCWNKKTTKEDAKKDTASESSQKTSSSDTSPKSLTVNLSFGQTHAQVKTLQRLLNAAGFAVADSGPGSSGNETDNFGSLTRIAVRAFQCAEKIVCGGDEYSTGYGYVGAKTRAALLAYEGKASAKQAKTTEGAPNVVQASTTAQSETSASEREAIIAELLKRISELQKQLAALGGV